MRTWLIPLLAAALAAASTAVAEEDFTVVLLPDTQKYAESYPEIFTSQTQWVVDNVDALNIVFVSQLGDIVENGGFGPGGSGDNTVEWDRANAALSMLDGHVPWGLVLGNHDFDMWYAPMGGSQYFLDRFGAPRFTDQPWFGGWSPDGYNSAQFFVGGGRRFMALHLVPDVPPWALAWAQSMIDAHPGVPTMITTHIYMKENGRTRFPYMDMYDPTWSGLSGNAIFAQLVKPNPQVFLVTCGHIAYERFQATLNDAGQPVLEMLADYQLRELGGNGLLRILKFSPNAGKIYASTYSTWYQAFETDADSLFEIPLDFARLGPVAGDVNCDGAVDFFDIDAFVLALSGESNYAAQYRGCRRYAADCDFDGDVDFFDIDPFVARFGA